MRACIEAAIDFPEEEIDFLSGAEVRSRLASCRERLDALLRETRRGQRLRDGLHVVIVGPPNVGKSSLLNVLAGTECAIVTDIAGTTRDLIRETVRLDGIEVTLVDTAGLRQAGDVIEAEGIRRARAEIVHADLVLALTDDSDRGGARADPILAEASRLIQVHNKIDLSGAPAHEERRPDGRHLWLSTLTGAGLDALRATLRAAAGSGADEGGGFSARARHVEALLRVGQHLEAGAAELEAGAGELAAEELRLAQGALGELTGRLAPDDLLGEIFGRFCIGK